MSLFRKTNKAIIQDNNEEVKIPGYKCKREIGTDGKPCLSVYKNGTIERGIGYPAQLLFTTNSDGEQTVPEELYYRYL